jgi:hypothetical protein
MWKYGKLFVALLAVGSMLGVTGCQTYGESAALGGVLGAGTGAIIGHQSDSAGEGALIGGALGALSGLIAHDVRARKQKSAQDTASQYDYQPAQGAMLKMEDAQVMPATIQPGGRIDAQIRYVVLGAGAGGATVNEKRLINKDGKAVYEISSQDFTRDDGTWESTQNFFLPKDAQPGQYSLMQTVRMGGNQISATSNFTVEG